MPAPSRLFAHVRLIAALTMGSRVLGLVREFCYSHFFGTSELLSAFRIAFMVPNLTRRLFGEGAMSAALIPTLTDSIQSEGEESSRRFVGAVLTMLVVGLILIVIAAEAVVLAGRALWDDPVWELTAIMLPYMALICTVAVVSGILNVRHHFAAPAAAPILLNLTIIGGVVGGALVAGLQGMKLVYVACGSVLLGGVAQLAVTGIALWKVSFFPIFSGAWRDPRIRKVFVMMGPMMLGLSAVQVNSLADHLIAYLFVAEEGERVGPAVLGYAQHLYQLPLGVLGISLATAVFPLLSRKAAEGDTAGLARTTEQGLRLALFMALPAAVGLIFVAQPLVAVIFQHGRFDASGTERVAGTLIFYSLGLPAYFAQHIVVRAFYAMKNSVVPARVAVSMVAVNLAMNFALVFHLEERGLALATATCAVIQVVWLSAKLRGAVPQISWRNVATGAGGSMLATAFMAAVLTGVVFLLAGRADRWVTLVVVVAAGVAAYVAAARLLRIEELGIALRASRKTSDSADLLDE